MSRSILPLGLLLLLAPAAALATEEFPRQIERQVGTAGPPPCSVCHTGDVTARYTVTTPFARALRARGLIAEDSDSLDRALQELLDEDVDSDKDDVGDIAELEAGTDPNQPDGQPGQDVGYGCTLGMSRPPPATALTFLCAGLLGLVIARRGTR